MRVSFARLLSLLSVFLSFGLITAPGFSASSAVAGEIELISFFGTLEDDWRGEGRTQSFDLSGALIEDLEFDMELEIDQVSRELTWEFNQEIKRENSTTSYETFRYSVNGDRLWISNVSAAEPVEVVESQNNSLTYRFERYEWWTRRVYHFEVSLRFQNARTVLGTRSVTLNGNIVEQQDFTLKRR